MSDDKRGLYSKYIVLTRDPVELKRGKFVLSPETDPASFACLKLYARRTSNTQLRYDLRAWIKTIRKMHKGEPKWIGL